MLSFVWMDNRVGRQCRRKEEGARISCLQHREGVFLFHDANILRHQPLPKS